MKFSAQEEYGLRCLLQIGRAGPEKSVTIPEISRSEGITVHNVAKILRILRRGGFIESVRGHTGGYTLARTPKNIVIGEVLAFLGGRLFDPSFCARYAGPTKNCTHSVDCSIRSLWRNVQSIVDYVLSHTSLEDLLGNEREQDSRLSHLADATILNFMKPTATPAIEMSPCILSQLKLDTKVSS